MALLCPICKSPAQELARTDDATGFYGTTHSAFKVANTVFAEQRSRNYSREQWEAENEVRGMACYNEQRFLSPAFGASTIHSKELNMTALQGWIVIGLLVLIMLGIVGIGAEIEYLPYVWRTYSP